MFRYVTLSFSFLLWLVLTCSSPSDPFKDDTYASGQLEISSLTGTMKNSIYYDSTNVPIDLKATLFLTEYIDSGSIVLRYGDSTVCTIMDTLFKNTKHYNNISRDTVLVFRRSGEVTILLHTYSNGKKQVDDSIGIHLSQKAIPEMFTVEDDTLELHFNDSTGEYTSDVPYDQAFITLPEFSGDSGSIIIVNGDTLKPGSERCSLSVGENTITADILNPDDDVIASYMFTVTRLPEPVTTLSSLTLSEGTLSPDFHPDTQWYTVSLDYEDSLVTFTPECTDENASVRFGDSSGIEEVEIPFSTGTDSVLFTVTAEDGETERIYTIVVDRTGNDNAELEHLETSEGELKPEFDADIREYDVTVPEDADSIHFDVTTEDGNATVKINKRDADTRFALTPMDETTFSIVVTAENGSTKKVYMVTVFRTGSGDATLSDIESSTGAFFPSFSSDNPDYELRIPSDASSITVRPECVHPRATVTVRGTSVTAGEWSQSISVARGLETSFDIVVTSEDGKSKKTYHVAVNRAYALSVEADSNGTVEPEGTVDAFVSVPLTLEAEPAYGFYFDSWEVTEGEARIDAVEEASSEVTVTAAASVTAHFKRKRYHLALTSDGNGTAEGSDSLYHEERGTIKATANTGYHFEYWESVSGSVELDDADEPVTLVALDSGNAVLQARFSIDHYYLSVVSGEHGEVAGSDSVAYNEWTTVTALSSTGYHFAGWQTDSGTATFENAAADTTRVRLTNGSARIRGTFSINTYTLSLVEDGNGSTDGAGTVEHGDPVTITALPQSGYPFLRWDLTGGDAQITDASATETTVRVYGDATITARFMKYDTVYVDATADNGNAGNSWEHALNNLQTALTYAHEGSVIHMAEGTYRPSVADRDVAFVVLNGMKLYGGYPSGGGTRNSSEHPVVLSGELQNDGDTTNNSSRVVFMENVDASCVIDGITITGGYAVSSPRGAGLMIENGSPEITHCVFSRNYCLADESSDSCRGSALYIADGSPVVQNCTFSDNKCLLDESGDHWSIHSKFSGGAVYSAGGEPRFDNCVFNDNQCHNRPWDVDGGCLYMTNGALENCAFTGNTSVGTDYCENQYGGAVYMENGSVVNCTFSDNRIIDAYRSHGGALCMINGRVENCTFSGNSCSSHGGGYYGGAVEVQGGTISGCIFSGNFCDTSQSAYSQACGGAVFAGVGNDLSIINCTFNGNLCGSSRSNSGALYLHTNGADVSVTNCTFHGNGSIGRSQAFGGGIGVNALNGHCYLTNCTLAENETNGDSTVGGALYIASTSTDDVILTNTIFWENSADYDQEISGDATQIRNSVIQGGYSGGGDVSQLYTTDPQLGELDDNGGPVPTISITSGASAHNHGTTSVPNGVDISADARGISRGAQPDIGAYEIYD